MTLIESASVGFSSSFLCNKRDVTSIILASSYKQTLTFSNPTWLTSKFSHSRRSDVQGRGNIWSYHMRKVAWGMWKVAWEAVRALVFWRVVTSGMVPWEVTTGEQGRLGCSITSSDVVCWITATKAAVFSFLRIWTSPPPVNGQNLLLPWPASISNLPGGVRGLCKLDPQIPCFFKRTESKCKDGSVLTEQGMHAKTTPFNHIPMHLFVFLHSVIIPITLFRCRLIEGGCRKHACIISCRYGICLCMHCLANTHSST